MSRWALSTKLGLSLAVAALFLVVGLLSLRSIMEVNASRRWSIEAQAVSDATVTLAAATVRAESSQRGYLLTGEARYLTPYRAEVAAARAALARLAALSRSHPARRRRAEALAPRVAAKVAEMDATLAAMARGDRAGALDIVRTDAGRGSMAEIQALADASVADERRTLGALRARVERHLRGSYRTILAGSVLAFAILVLLDVSIWRDVRQRERDRALITAQAGDLRAHAESLAQRERSLAARVAEQQALMTELSRVNATFDEEARHREELIGALAVSNQELEQFAYVASHDLKAPLRGIGNLADWIAEDLGEGMPAAVAENLRLLRGRVTRMEGLIAGILAYARAGREVPAVEVDLRTMLTEVVELLSPPAGTRIVVEGPMPTLCCEAVLLEQVWMNLLSNALKHGGGSEVTVGSRDLGEVWEFSVRDRGPGIDPRYHERIFAIFQTLASRDKVEGTGIGLALVKKIVESRGGRVKVESAPGSGATFRFTWPRHRLPGRRPSSASRPPSAPATS